MRQRSAPRTAQLAPLPRASAAPPLPESAGPFRLLTDGVKDYAIIMLDTEGRVVYWNAGAERLLGYQEAEILGHHFSCFFTPEDIERGLPQRELQRARKRGRAENDHWHVRKDGTRFWSSGVTTPLWDATLRGYATVMRDLSEQKRAQDALRESEQRHRELAQSLEEMLQRRERFLAVLSHELRNPLAPIVTALQIMQLNQSDDPDQVEAQNVIERQVGQLVRLIDDLLDTSRLTAGKLQLRKEPVELSVVVQRAAETSRPFVDERKHKLSLSFPDAPLWLHADPGRLEQVFLNLLNNAAKYTSEGGDIQVTAERQEASAVVRIRDSGIGIPADMLESIFEMFAQADRSQEQSSGGLGIGLTLVKRLVDMHGGSVAVHSDGRGKGSEFTIRLPIVPESPPIPQNDAGNNG